ncbi:lysophospholipid acyltransferase LPEAT1-like [Zingiber officinale]|uniref:lysophospholipid acyltransferase LPEAT1-like n=1 Tax=Zingiber officinale TaxID=94328 RepID=UPI001C4B7EB1|nr:lysophospholipid acyltransferase LPEAT1-like [Zingiber officinale]
MASADLAGGGGSEADSSHFVPGDGGASATPKDDQPLLESDSSPASVVAAAVPISPEELERKYAPYVRRDAYGVMGLGQLPATEKVMLGIAAVTLVPIRVVAGVLILVLYYLICRMCTLFSPPSRENGQEDYAHMTGWRRAVVVRCGRFASRAMLFTFGFYWIKETRLSLDNEVNEFEKPGAVVSNHISYVDILYHMSSAFPSFVAKRSVAQLPLVGLISKCLGCVYVQRESKSSNFKGVSGIVTERIQKAHKDSLCPMMLLFPEGTTTNGDYLLPFKSGAFLAKAPVVPVILKYPYGRFSPAWDSISGVRHVCLLLCQFVNHLEVIHLPVYYPSDQEKEDPKLYAGNVRKLMATEGNLTLSDIGLAEKRIYHAVLNGNSLPRVLREKGD